MVQQGVALWEATLCFFLRRDTRLQPDEGNGEIPHAAITADNNKKHPYGCFLLPYLKLLWLQS